MTVMVLLNPMTNMLKVIIHLASLITNKDTILVMVYIHFHHCHLSKTGNTSFIPKTSRFLQGTCYQRWKKILLCQPGVMMPKMSAKTRDL